MIDGEASPKRKGRKERVGSAHSPRNERVALLRFDSFLELEVKVGARSGNREKGGWGWGVSQSSPRKEGGG